MDVYFTLWVMIQHYFVAVNFSSCDHWGLLVVTCVSSLVLYIFGHFINLWQHEMFQALNYAISSRNGILLELFY